MKNALRPQQLPHVMEGLKKLCKMTNVFPTPDQQLWLGQKVRVMDQLAEIANAVTKTVFPKYFVIKDPLDPRIMKRDNLHIQRSYSHSRLGIQPGSNLDQFKEKLQKWVRDTEDGYDHEELRQLDVEPRWVGMSFLETLRGAGEARVYLVGGRVRRILHTKPKLGGLSASQSSEDFVG